eukprot:690792-Hanusia_phi.AAC.1
MLGMISLTSPLCLNITVRALLDNIRRQQNMQILLPVKPPPCQPSFLSNLPALNPSRSQPPFPSPAAGLDSLCSFRFPTDTPNIYKALSKLGKNCSALAEEVSVRVLSRSPLTSCRSPQRCLFTARRISSRARTSPLRCNRARKRTEKGEHGWMRIEAGAGGKREEQEQEQE